MHFRVLFLLKQGRTNSAEICTEYCPRGRNYRLSILQESPGHLEDEGAKNSLFSFPVEFSEFWGNNAISKRLIHNLEHRMQ